MVKGGCHRFRGGPGRKAVEAHRLLTHRDGGGMNHAKELKRGLGGHQCRGALQLSNALKVARKREGGKVPQKNGSLCTGLEREEQS